MQGPTLAAILIAVTINAYCDCVATDESSSGKDSEIEAKEEDAYEEEGDGWLAWEDNYVENQEKKSQPAYSLKIRVWPGYANIVLFGAYDKLF